MTSEDLNLKFEQPLHYKLVKEGKQYRLLIEQENGWRKLYSTPTPEYIPVSQWFGENGAPFYKTLGWLGHNGLDFTCPTGSKVYAMMDGVVDSQNSESGMLSTFSSEMITAKSEVVKLRIVYGHLDHYLVKVGEQVKAGQLIAISDNKGKYTTGAHLHINVMPYVMKNGSFTCDRKNGYDGSIDFKDWLDTTVIYEKKFKKLERDELIDYFAKTCLSGISNANWEKLKAGDDKVASDIKKQMITNITNAPLAVILTEQHGEVWIEENVS